LGGFTLPLLPPCQFSLSIAFLFLYVSFIFAGDADKQRLIDHVNDMGLSEFETHILNCAASIADLPFVEVEDLKAVGLVAGTARRIVAKISGTTRTFVCPSLFFFRFFTASHSIALPLLFNRSSIILQSLFSHSSVTLQSLFSHSSAILQQSLFNHSSVTLQSQSLFHHSSNPSITLQLQPYFSVLTLVAFFSSYIRRKRWYCWRKWRKQCRLQR
jgi:hypothetical protein